MDLVVQYIPSWVIWTHHQVAPWGGWGLAAMIAILGPLWLYRSLRRAGRALKRRISSWLGQRSAVKTGEAIDELLENCALEGGPYIRPKQNT